MSKKMKASFVKTNIAKPVKLELFRIMKDYHTQRDREQAVARSKEIHDLSQVFKFVPISRDTFKRLKGEVNEMPFSEVLSLPKDLQDWIIEIRPDLKQDLVRQRLEQSSKSPTASSGIPIIIPKRIIKSQIIERKIVDGKVEDTHRIELY